MGLPPSFPPSRQVEVRQRRIAFVTGSPFLTLSTIVSYRIDDAVDAIPVHMFGGAWGVIATGLFSSPQRMQDWLGRDTDVGWYVARPRKNVVTVYFQLYSLT